MTALWCKRCGRFHDSSEECRERSSRGHSGPTTLPGAIFQGLFLGIMFGFPFGQLTNKPEPFLAVALPIWFLRVAYHVVKHRKPRAAASDQPQVAKPSFNWRPVLRWVGRIALGLAVVAGLIVAGVWWSQRPTREDFLHRAARRGEASELRRLLDEGPPGPGEASALAFAAASSGSVPTVSLLLERGVDVNQQTMLHVAVKHHHLDLVRFLLQHGVDTSLPGVDGVTPLGVAARSAADLPIVRALLEGGASPNDWWALYNAPNEVLPVLLDATETPEAVSADGRTNLLSLAANRGDATGARTLLAKGAAVDKAPPNGPRPLIAALNGRRPVLVGVLLEHGASPDSSSDAEPPPLEVAVEQGLPEAAQLLLEKGARIEQCPKLRGESPGAIVEYAKKRK